MQTPPLPWESNRFHSDQDDRIKIDRRKRNPLHEINPGIDVAGSDENQISPSFPRLASAKTNQGELRERIDEQFRTDVDFNNSMERTYRSCEDSNKYSGANEISAIHVATENLQVNLGKIHGNRKSEFMQASSDALDKKKLSSPATSQNPMEPGQSKRSSSGKFLIRQNYCKQASDSVIQTHSIYQQDVHQQPSNYIGLKIRSQSLDRMGRTVTSDHKGQQQTRMHLGKGFSFMARRSTSQRTTSTSSMSSQCSHRRENVHKQQQGERQETRNNAEYKRRRFLVGRNSNKAGKQAEKLIQWIRGVPTMKQKSISKQTDSNCSKGEQLVRIRNILGTRVKRRHLSIPESNLSSTEATAMMMDQIILTK